MAQEFEGKFLMFGADKAEKLRDATLAEKYGAAADWARRARAVNPLAFDALTGWMLDDAQWEADSLAENRRVLIDVVLAGFKAQNARLREFLTGLESPGRVNAAVFTALDRFDAALAGKTGDRAVDETAARVFSDFRAMKERPVRELFAGEKTGPAGTDSVDVFGYVNRLKECDAQVQWMLFMPSLTEEQQNGFKMDGFEYRKMPALRFIGREDADAGGKAALAALFSALDAMSGYASGFDYDILFMHHCGRGVDAAPCRRFWGRFFRAGTPVPDGCTSFDFTPEDNEQAGPPYLSQFAYATFFGDSGAMHRHDGYDCDAMYDVTRNVILGQGVCIPYPHKYWTAEAFRKGVKCDGDAYLFSVKL